MRYLDDLRFDRATVMLRHGEVRPMQTETYRLMQASADKAYTEGLRRIKSGRLKIRMSVPETLGNFVDRSVRGELRERYSNSGIDASGSGPVRVNRRENNSSEGTFRRPDARVDDVAYDVTIANKTLKTLQIRGFFATDFSPAVVVNIRPSQLGPDSSYIITRPRGLK